MMVLCLILVIGILLNGCAIHAYDAHNCVLFFAIDSDKWMQKEWFRLVFMVSSVIGTLCYIVDKLYYFSNYNPD